MKGFFTGEFYLYPLPQDGKWWGKERYEFRLNPTMPLTWHVGRDGYQPDRHFESDGGSIPRLVQAIPAFQKDRYWKSYGFHDCAYLYGGIYRNGKFVKESRATIDRRLQDQLMAEGATKATARTVYGFVRAFGWLCWDSKKQAQCRVDDGIVM